MKPTAGLEPAIAVSGGRYLNQLGQAGFLWGISNYVYHITVELYFNIKLVN